MNPQNASPEKQPAANEPPPELSILYEDADLIAVEKPAGIHTAPLSTDPTGTLLEAILTRWPEISRLPGRKPVEPGLLHRLDRETSGIVVAARTENAFHALSRAFAEGRVGKQYIALCRVEIVGRGTDGSQTPQPGVDLRIESRFAPYGPGRRMVRAITADDAGKPRSREATRDIYVTEALIERVHGTLALVRARIYRGFRHQVRAHLSALGLPIVGDPLYGGREAGDSTPGAAAPRMFLHACRIALESPSTGLQIEIASPLPRGFLESLETG